MGVVQQVLEIGDLITKCERAWRAIAPAEPGTIIAAHARKSGDPILQHIGDDRWRATTGDHDDCRAPTYSRWIHSEVWLSSVLRKSIPIRSRASFFWTEWTRSFGSKGWWSRAARPPNFAGF